jgi:CheY-like chemotaxis protein
VIEESYEIANMLKRVLFSIDHSVTTFTKQVDALEELMKNKHYDVIITDDFLREQSAVHQHDALTAP